MFFRRNQFLQSFWRRLIAEPVDDIDREQQAFLSSPQAKRFDQRVVICLLTGALLLALRQYYFHAGPLFKGLLSLAGVLQASNGDWATSLRTLQADSLVRLCVWSAGQCLAFFVLPAMIVKFVFREKLADYGWKLKGSLRDWPLYLAMYLALAPFILWFSTNPSFRSTYPFYRADAGEPFWPRMAIWQCFYAAQFIALEFFFRGFLIHGLRRRFGLYSIFVAAVPYCMLHFEKPFPETVSSLFGGVILGYMSLKNRSIVLGAALHIAIAFTMDFAASVNRTL